MKIAFIPSWYPTDANPFDGTFFREWAGYFAESGHEVSVIASLIHPLSKAFTRPLDHSKDSVEIIEKGNLTEYIQESINVHPYLEKPFYKRYSNRLNKLFLQVVERVGRPDALIIHSSLWAGGGLAETLNDIKVPYIVFEHLKELMNPEKLTPVQRSALRKSWKNARAIIAISGSMEKAYGTIAPEYSDRFIRIPNPVDTDYFSPSLNARDSSSFQFISVALQRKEKAIGHLLEAFKIALEKNPDLKLSIHGNGPELKKNQKLVSSLGIGENVTVPGYSNREQVRNALQNSDCFVMPSRVETFGLAAIEALSVGIPVIATKCGGPSDFITPESGVLIPVSNSPSVLSDAMLKMSRDAKKYDSKAIRERIVENFDRNVYVKKCIDIFTNDVDRKH